MVEAEYDVLAGHLLAYYNKFSKEHFVAPLVLFRSPSLEVFLAQAHATPPSTSSKGHNHLSTIWKATF